jgi:rare lipoprotein A
MRNRYAMPSSNSGRGGPAASRVKSAARTIAFLFALAPAWRSASIDAAAQAASIQTGVASYYAREFHGKTTANGETYSMWAMTAAHQTLPFNSIVKVTNLDNGRTTSVRINDAGPFKDDRIIDLSYAAAVKLGMVGPGKARVRLEVKGNADPGNSRSEFFRVDIKKASLDGFAVQLGSYTDPENLLRRLGEFERKGVRDMHVQITNVSGRQVHRILVGGFRERAEAESFCVGLKKKGLRGMVMRIR